MRSRRLALLVAAALTLSLAVPLPAFAAADDVFPGVPLPASPVGGDLTPAGKADVEDVYSVALAAGDEVTLSLQSAAGTEFSLALFDSAVGTDEWQSLFWFWQPGPRETSYVVPQGHAGTYYVVVHAMDASGSAGSYTLTWSKRTEKAARLYGMDRYATAAAISRSSFVTAGAAVLASGENYPDALAASGLAGVLNAPVLLTRRDAVPDVVLRELQRLGVRDIKVIGSNAVVSDEVYASLADQYRMERIAGGNRFETARKVAERVKELGGSREAFLVSGRTYADALSVSPVAFARKMPVVLTEPDALSADARVALESLGATHAVIAGSVNAVSAKTADAAAAVLRAGAAGGAQSLERWEGPDRFQTAAAVAQQATQRGWAGWGQVAVATGFNFPDALGGGAALGSRGGVLLLTQQSSLAPATNGALATHKASVSRAYLLGSAVAIADGVRSAMLSALQ